jgi:Protein of unknown function (DUF667)
LKIIGLLLKTCMIMSLDCFSGSYYINFQICLRALSRVASSRFFTRSGKTNPKPNFFLRSKPLQIWDKNVRNGHIKRITDPDIQSSVLEIMGTNVSTNYITCPVDPKKTLAIKLPFLVMIIKNVRNNVLSNATCVVEEVLHF